MVARRRKEDRHHVGHPEAGKGKARNGHDIRRRQCCDQYPRRRDQPRHPERADRAEPVAHAVAQKPHHRHGACEQGKGQTRPLQRGIKGLGDIKRRPVEHRALRGHREQRHPAQNVQHRDLGKHRRLGFGSASGPGIWLAPQKARGDDQDAEGDHRNPQGLLDRAKPGQREPADPAAGKAAKAPEPVRRRHDRPADALLDLDRIGVHRYVHAAKGAPHQDEAGGEEIEVGGEHDQRQNGGDKGAEQQRHLARSVGRDQLACEHHGGHSAQTDQQDQEAQCEFGDLMARQQKRDLRRPGAGDEAVDEEQRGHRPAPAFDCLHVHYALLFCAVIDRNRRAGKTRRNGFVAGGPSSGPSRPCQRRCRSRARSGGGVSPRQPHNVSASRVP